MAPNLRKDRERQGQEAELKRLITERYPALPAHQRNVADYLLQHSGEIPFLSVVELEKRTGVSKATVVRLAQSLGFRGFLELRTRLMESVQQRLRGPGEYAFPGEVDSGDTLQAVARQDIRNINRTVANLDREAFREAAGMILEASTVYTAGIGISALMARTLAYSLTQTAIRALPLQTGSGALLEQLPLLAPGDLLIVFSFPPYSRETVELARNVSETLIPIVAITDKATSPVSFHASRVLPIQSQNMLFTNSFSAISVVINALATEVALRNKDKALAQLKRVDHLLRDVGHYMDE